jgi:eukaryotic-like serine/threonine-protein kinase
LANGWPPGAALQHRPEREAALQMSGPARFGPYQLQRLLGQGATGRVDLALDGSGMPVALKRMPLSAVRHNEAEPEADTLARFEALSQRLQALQHPGIVACLGHGHEPDSATLWLAMAVAPGHALSQHLHAAHRLPDALVLEIGAQLASALAAAHAQGLLHRDLKPDNVRLQLQGGQAQAQLLDFGLSHLAGDAGSATATGVVLGSPAYMAPELLAGARPSAASDFYALGVLLYELLCLRLPFGAGEGPQALAALLRAVASQAPTPLAQTRPHWAAAAALQPLFNELLAKRPGERPADGQALAQRLRDIATQL